MPQVSRIRIVGLLLIASLLLMGGCNSSKNEDSLLEGETHPAGWLPAGHMEAAQANITSCQQCHGDDYSGGIVKVSCDQCHLGGYNSVHPISWGTGSLVVPNHAPYVTANGATGCSNLYCHGTNLEGATGPACSLCHLNGSPLTLTNCTSCHSSPPSGNVAPNRSGAHAPHNLLPNVTNVCDTCHNGAGSGTVNHDTGIVSVAFLSAYYAKSGTAVYNSDGTCSNVSCHGGQTTPGWLTGATIDVSTQCTSCHSFGTSQYNSFVSGQHDLHVNQLHFICTQCHDVLKLRVNHFVYLDTPVMEGPASATINSNINYNGNTCTPLCHGTQSW